MPQYAFESCVDIPVTRSEKPREIGLTFVGDWGWEMSYVEGMLDPVAFVARHNNVGDPAPDESRRMLAGHREALEQAQERHAERVACLEAAEKRLADEVRPIIGEASQ